MPLFPPPVTDERSALLTFLEQQRQALRASVHGLSDADAATAPSASEMSLAGLLKHVIRTERRWVVAGAGGLPLPGLWPIVDFPADFRLEPGETLAGLLAAYADAARETAGVVATFADLGETARNPDCAQWSARWVLLLHMIEETARHAGHADVIRESLDGAQAGYLLRDLEEGA